MHDQRDPKDIYFGGYRRLQGRVTFLLSEVNDAISKAVS